ncbi:MAG: accessory gene regulator B family protein [Peptococcaceae bacterium]|nr:accessory gene regulator B family protein [Peptococcaceae bacterium]
MRLQIIALGLARYLSKQSILEESQVDVARYGFELILGETFKYLFILTMAGILNVLAESMFALISVSIFRLTSGGNHCQDYWRCLILGILVFVGGGKLAVLSAADLFTGETILACFLIMLISVLLWAPGEAVHRRILENERFRFKLLSVLFLFFWTGTVFFLVRPYSVSIAIAGYLSMLFQVFSFSPWGYLFIDKYDALLAKIIGEGR